MPITQFQEVQSPPPPPVDVILKPLVYVYTIDIALNAEPKYN